MSTSRGGGSAFRSQSVVGSMSNKLQLLIVNSENVVIYTQSIN